MLKDLLDGLHHSEQLRGSDDQPTTTELSITGVHVYHNLALIEKGHNTEQGAPEWLKGFDHTAAYTET